jgi:predicted RNase H-like nuclease (RuvC/YqgF family)
MGKAPTMQELKVRAAQFVRERDRYLKGVQRKTADNKRQVQNLRRKLYDLDKTLDKMSAELKLNGRIKRIHPVKTTSGRHQTCSRLVFSDIGHPCSCSSP